MKAFWCAILSGVAIFGQPPVPAVQCTLNAPATPVVRIEGITELVGDLLLQCSGGTPTPLGQPVPLTSVQLSLNTAVTSRLLPGGFADALLLIDEPGSKQNPFEKGCFLLGGCPVLGTGNGATTYTAGNPNIYLGTVLGNSVLWEGVPIDPPGAQGKRMVRVTNVRANANQLGMTSPLTPQQIMASFTIGGPFSVIGNQPFPVATAQPGLLIGVPNPGSFQWCSGFNGNQVFSELTPGVPSPATFSMQFGENFPGAFKPQGGSTPSVPGEAYNTESAFAPNASGFPPEAGLADFGTRLRAAFNNIPTGVRINVSVNGTLTDSKGTNSGTVIAASPTGTVSGTTLMVTPDRTGTADMFFQVQTRDPNNSNPLFFTPTFTIGGSPSTLQVPFHIEATAGFPNSQFPQTSLFAPGSSLLNGIPTFNPLDSGVSAPQLIPYFYPASVVGCTNGGNSLNTSGPSTPNFINIFGPMLTGGSNEPVLGAEANATSATGPNLIAPRISNVGIVSAALPTTGVTLTKDPTATWLNANLSGTATPLTLYLSANNAAAGNYSTTLKVTGSGGNVLSVPVNYTSSQGPWFTRYGFANSASYVNNVVAPGEPFVIFGGDAFGPATLAGPALDLNGLVATTSGNTQVLFDGTPAPLYYSVNANGTGQVAGFAPFELVTKTQTNVQVVYNGVKSPPIQLFVLDAVPGLYTANASGGGQGSILNQDLSINSASNPEAVGNYVVLYGGGAGQTSPGGRDGGLAGVGAALAKFTLPVKVFIDGMAATDIPYAGPAPGLVEGVFQINVRIPSGVRHNANVPVLVQIEDKQTQPGVTLATK